MDSNVVILAKLAPPAATERELYRVPAGDLAFVRLLTCCHRSGNPNEFCRVSVSRFDAVTQPEDYILYDHVLAANDTLFTYLKFTMQAGDVMRVYASAEDITFILFGAVI